MATKFMFEDKELNFSSSSINDSASSSFSTYSSAKILNLLALKQNNLSFDTTPTANSNNPVTSAGVKTYVDSSISANNNKIISDSATTASSTWSSSKISSLFGDQVTFNFDSSTGTLAITTK